MKNIYITLFAVSCSILCSCTTYQGIPSHGGGKRFDEEQRLIAASIAKTVSQMDLSFLNGKTVLLEVSGVESSGCGSIGIGLEGRGGLTDINITGSSQKYTTETNFWANGLSTFAGDPVKQVSEITYDQVGANIPVKYRFRPEFSPERFITSKDVEYLKSVIRMKAHCSGVNLVESGEADACFRAQY